MPTMTIDGKIVSAVPGTTILNAARSIGIHIPSLCEYEAIDPPCSCLVCIVKIEGRSGFVPSCVAEIEDGIVVRSNDAEVVATRRRALELLLGEHAGECEGPCARVCPCAMDIPRMLRLIAEGEPDRALSCVKETMALPGILGYLCPAPCEKACRRKQVDRSIAIRDLHRHLAEFDRNGNQRRIPRSLPVNGKKVACIGAGPAGLSAVYYLSLRGYRCTVFDDHDRPGGTLSSGVSREAIPAAVLEGDIAPIIDLGVTLRMNTMVGRDISFTSIRNEFDAVILAVGGQTSPGDGRREATIGDTVVTIDPENLTTDIPGIFVCGGVVTPGKMAARSAGQGRRVADMAQYYVNGDSALSINRGPRFDAHPGAVSDEELAHLAATGIINTGAVAGFAPTVNSGPVKESARCLQCDCGKKTGCALRQAATDAGISRQPPRSGTRRKIHRQFFTGGLVVESGKCILCGRCVGITSGTKPGLSFLGRGFDVRVGAPFGMSIDEAMGNLLHQCVEACPTGALRILQKPEDS